LGVFTGGLFCLGRWFWLFPIALVVGGFFVRLSGCAKRSVGGKKHDRKNTEGQAWEGLGMVVWGWLFGARLGVFELIG
jgi:hypothetical protein